MTPDNGTAIEARSTPCDAAKAMVRWAKWFGPAIWKIIKVKNRRLGRATRPRDRGSLALEIGKSIGITLQQLPFHG
jgi:hypothetical protein